MRLLWLFLFHGGWGVDGPSCNGCQNKHERAEGKQGSPSPCCPPIPGAVTRAWPHDAHQALHRLEQLVLLALQEAELLLAARRVLGGRRGRPARRPSRRRSRSFSPRSGLASLPVAASPGLAPVFPARCREGRSAQGEPAAPTVQSQSRAFPWVLG